MTMQTGDEDGRSFDSRGQSEIEGRDAPEGTPTAVPKGPPAGPHAKPELTNPEATAGTGALPDPTPDGEADAATG